MDMTNDAESLFQVLSQKRNVQIYWMDEKDIEDISSLLPNTISTVKATEKSLV